MTPIFWRWYPKQIIPRDKIHDAILNPPISWYGGYIFFDPVKSSSKNEPIPLKVVPKSI